ncbi:MAG: small basic protein [Phycisphaerae bacterium]
MSRDKSLKGGSALTRHRNVLTRNERIEKLKEDGRWTEDSGPFGLPKVAHRKASVGTKTKKAAKTEETEAAPAAEGDKAAS